VATTALPASASACNDLVQLTEYFIFSPTDTTHFPQYIHRLQGIKVCNDLLTYFQYFFFADLDGYFTHRHSNSQQ
jgi:hypothetical protein